eukprot:TRINITY_DN11573_c0_g2_i2.p1 TRINITY_DN11573_c0_g2~~TRINITY_DN11573_c0_g2_i2.p1  ORF type:complete len:192 (+),score=51.30 TRINITY_DN11573_c0_g2_i2:297-872(+)
MFLCPESSSMDKEDVAAWEEVDLSVIAPSKKHGDSDSASSPTELEREKGERRRGREVLVAIDHGSGSKHAFDWAIVHLCRMADTLHLVHVVSDLKNEAVKQATRSLMEKLAKEATEVAMVQTKGRILEGEKAKAICSEAERIRPAALVMGTRGLGIIKSLLYGSVSEYCYHHCICPVIVVPSKEAGDQSVI